MSEEAKLVQRLTRATAMVAFTIGVFGHASDAGANTVISPDDPNIAFQGTQYVKSDDQGVYFQRHSDFGV